MAYQKFDVAKLERLNDPARFDSIRPEVLWSALASEAPGVVVEIGAGTGLFSASLCESAPDATVYAADVEPLMVEWMQEHRLEVSEGRIIPVRCRESDIPLPDNIADAVIMVNLHHELVDPQAVYGEAFRLLAPGGRVLVVDWARRATPGGPPLRVRVSSSRLARTLELAGFERIDVDERSLDRHILATATRPGTAALRYESGGAPLCRIRGEQESRLISFALHAGHVLRPGLARHMGIGPGVRRREEDPLTALMAPPHGRTIEVLRSRFEIDLNRPIERAVYGGPEDAWGLNVWRDGVLVQDEAVASRLVYEEFYRIARDEVAAVISADTPCILLDLHSYNHRRGGSEAPAADPVSNPEINIGTRSIDRERWAPVIDAFIKELRSAGLDVGENVKFGGGHLCRWVAADFSEVVCPLAIEFKKTFVDEWSGVPDRKRIDSLRTAVAVASKAAVQASSQMR